MRRAGALALLATLAAAPGPDPAPDPAEVRRGAEAVGDKTSEQPALRARPGAPAGFRLGASYRAWRNAAAAVRFDADHSTGDGGDAEALAIDCGDERLAFAALEAARSGDEAAVAAAAGDPSGAAAWRARRAGPPAACR